MTATSFSIATTRPLTTEPSTLSFLENDSSRRAAKSSRVGCACATCIETPDRPGHCPSARRRLVGVAFAAPGLPVCFGGPALHRPRAARSEEHTSELQSRLHLVCRLLLEKKK